MSTTLQVHRYQAVKDDSYTGLRWHVIDLEAQAVVATYYVPMKAQATARAFAKRMNADAEAEHADAEAEHAMD